LIFIDFFFYSFQLIEEQRRGKSIEVPESSSEDEDDDDTENAEEDSDEDDNSSNSDGDVDASFDHEETSPKVDITG
jgi:hypothetical protein